MKYEFHPEAQRELYEAASFALTVAAINAPS
jgi:hypothetical protein